MRPRPQLATPVANPVRLPPIGRSAALAALLAVACFSESAADGQPSATDDSPTCDPGLTMCPCREDGSCDPGLECVAAAQVCAPQGCTPGALDCICVDGSCLGGLHCGGAGFCVEPPAGSGTSDATVSSTTLDPASSSGSPVSDSASSSAGATTDDMCNPLTCGTCGDCTECLACAVEGGPCEDERAACTGDCETLLGCVEQCDPSPSQCPMTCCCQSTTAWETYNALTTCLYEQCTSCARPLCVTLEC